MPKPNVPPRSPNTNFPPPPRRPPPPKKTNYQPPPSGGSRYTSFGRETGSSYASSAAEDVKAKTDDFKAWEQMRHGQGPAAPSWRSVPPKYARKASTFSPGHEAGSSLPKDSMPKRSMWGQFEDVHPGIPRSKTARVPKRTGFAPGTPGGEESQTRTTSAYSNVFRGEQTTPSKANTHLPRPPPRPGTTSKMPDPLHQFKTHLESESPFVKNGRVSTPYATAGGEKTYFSSQGLGRSTSWREGRHPSEWYDSEPNNMESPHPRATSAASDGNRSASPKMTSPKQPRPVSSSSSSTSSSDESVQKTAEDDFYRFTRRSNGTGRSRAPDVMNGHQRPGSKASVNFSDIKGQSGTARDFRKHRQEDQHARNASAEGFMQHRMDREAERHRQQPPHNTTSKPHSPTNQTTSQRPLHRPRSWHHNDGSTDNANGARKEQNGGPPMYDSPGNSPSSTSSSHKWSDQWPFMSPKKPRMPTAAPPPYWAIPSSLAPRKQAEDHGTPGISYPSSQNGPCIKLNTANQALLNSFTFPEGESQKFTKHAPPLRSHSSETINMNFSPSEWSGKFTGSGNEYFAPPPPNRNGVVQGRSSPIKSRPLHNKPARPQQHRTDNIPNNHSSDANTSPARTQRSPSLPAESDYSAEEWAKYFKPAIFAYPPPPSGSPTRATNRKRPKTPSKFSKPTFKRPAVSKAPDLSACVDDAEDELDAGSIAESLSSRTSGGESAMDIDRTLTPPYNGQPQVNGASQLPTQSDQVETTPRPLAPPIPPRVGVNVATDDPHLNLTDLKKVEPFAPSQNGLENLDEIKSTLPFESRTSTHAGTRPTPQALVPPNPPKAPQMPEKLTQPAQERYMAQMAVYMLEWNTYNTKMLSHFNERQSSVEKTLKPGWMAARGDSFEKYLQGVEEDFRVREHWELSWEKHRDCINCLGNVRNKLLSA